MDTVNNGYISKMIKEIEGQFTESLKEMKKDFRVMLSEIKDDVKDLFSAKNNASERIIRLEENVKRVDEKFVPIEKRKADLKSIEVKVNVIYVLLTIFGGVLASIIIKYIFDTM